MTLISKLRLLCLCRRSVLEGVLAKERFSPSMCSYSPYCTGWLVVRFTRFQVGIFLLYFHDWFLSTQPFEQVLSFGVWGINRKSSCFPGSDEDDDAETLALKMIVSENLGSSLRNSQFKRCLLFRCEKLAKRRQYS